MLVYNTTYHVTFDDARNFVIWIHQVYIPQALASRPFGQTAVMQDLVPPRRGFRMLFLAIRGGKFGTAA